MYLRVLVFFGLFLLRAMAVFAAGDDLIPPGMMTLARSVKDIFTGDLIRIILVCILCGAAIAFAYNKDNEKIKRTCIVIAVATGILIAASTIIDKVWDSAGG